MADNSNLDPEIVRAFNDALLNVSRSIDPKIEADRKAAQQTKEVEDAMKGLKKEVRANAVELLKATTSISGGTTKYAAGVEKAAGALGSISSLLVGGGGLGWAIKGVITGMGKLASSSLEQNDKLMKTYQDLSKFGANSSSSFKDMMSNFQRAGFTVESAGAFVASLQKAAPELALFGGTVGDGSKRLTKFFSQDLDNNTRYLMRFGVTAEEMFDLSASYISNQSSMGVARLKTDKQLNQESVQYIETLSELSMLTGMQRDDLAKQRKAHENDIRYQMHLRKLGMGTEEEKAEASRKQAQLQLVESKMGKEAAEGLKSAWVNANRAVDGPAISMMTTVGPNAFNNMVNAYKRAGDPVAAMGDVMNENVPEIKSRFDALGGAINIGKDATKGFFDTSMAFKGLLAGEAFDREKLNDSMNGVVTEEKNDRIKQNADRFIAERKLTNTVENIQFSVGNVAVPAVTKFAEITNVAAGALAKLVKAMTFGAVDFTKEFKDATDITKEAKETYDEFKKTGKELVELENKKKNLVKGSAAEQKINQEIAAKRGTQRSLAAKLTSQDQQRQQLGGSSIFSQGGSAARQVQEALSEPANTIQTGTIDSLFSFSNASARDRFSKLNGNLAEKLVAAATEYSKATNGRKLQINSTLRTPEEQAKLYADYQNGGTVAAPPGQSKHENGLAVDIQQGKGDSQAIRILNSHGLHQTVKGDEVHFEGAYNGGIFKGPKSGYWTKLHGTEGVFNEKQMAAMSNNITKAAIPGGSGINTASSDMKDFYIAMIEKLDALVELQHTNNRTGEEHLRYARTS